MRNENKNFKPRTKEPFKMNVLTYEKEYEFFNDMIVELKGLHPEIEEIFNYDDAEYEYHPDDALVDVLNHFGEHYPNITDRVNLPVSLSVASNSLKYKTNSFYTLAYNFKYDKEGNISNIKAQVTVYSRGEKDTDAIVTMNNYLSDLENGWYKVTFKK